MPTVHFVSDTDPVIVTGAAAYRVSHTFVLMPGAVGYAEMELSLPAAARRPGGYGLVFLESEEHQLLYVGLPDQIRALPPARPLPASTVDTSRGTLVAGWPQAGRWGHLVPASTWFRGGQGILVELPHRGGQVVAYEYVEESGSTLLVGYHCQVCHSPGAHQSNQGPRDRRLIGRLARHHVHRADRQCVPPDPRVAERVAAARNAADAATRPVVYPDAICATEGECARIRHIRARMQLAPRPT